MLRQPVEFLVSLVEALLLVAFLFILLPLLLPVLPELQVLMSRDVGWAAVDPVIPLTVALVLVSPTVHMLLQAHFANSEVYRQQSLLRSRAEMALSKSPVKQEEDVEYVQLRNYSRKVFGNALLSWNQSGRALGLFEPVMVLYSALLAVGLAAISRLNFIII